MREWPPPRPRVVDQTQIGSLPGEEGLPRVIITRRRALALGLFVASVVAFLYFVLPKLAGLGKTWDRLGQGAPGWLAVAAAFELLSFAGYVAAQMVVFMTLLYAVYMAALVLFGIGLRTGLLPGGGGFAITILPAIFGGGVLLLIMALTLLPADVEVRLAAWAARRGPQRRGARVLARLVTMPAVVANGVRGALEVARSRDPLVIGAIAWWGFDIATLWASFRAFGAAPAFSVVVMAYFVGMLANVLPLPGGIGGVDGGMIGAFIAFGVGTPIAVVAVLVYRAFAFWLPTVPGGIAYIQLRRRVAGWAAGGGALDAVGTTA
jgi:hypothetical protein